MSHYPFGVPAEQLDELQAPFDPEAVSWRVGSTTKDKSKGMALAYIDARDVMQRLDETVGPENWQDQYTFEEGSKKIVLCSLGIRIADVGWVWKIDGAGESDIEAEKGIISDALKRAAVKWGVGRYLYNLDSPWVEIEGFGQSYRIAKHEHARLRAMLGGKQEETPPPKKQTPSAKIPTTPQDAPHETNDDAAERKALFARLVALHGSETAAQAVCKAKKFGKNTPVEEIRAFVEFSEHELVEPKADAPHGLPDDDPLVVRLREACTAAGVDSDGLDNLVHETTFGRTSDPTAITLDELKAVVGYIEQQATKRNATTEP